VTYRATIRCDGLGCTACVPGEGISQALANLNALSRADALRWDLTPDRLLSDEDFCPVCRERYRRAVQVAREWTPFSRRQT
jgi:hypothetical protein